MKVIRKYSFNFDRAIEMLEKSTKNFICFRRELKLYKTILKSFENLTYVCENDVGKRSQFYEMQFGGISETSGLEYIMIWNIQKAEKLINDKKLVPIQYKVDDYISKFNDTEIDKKYAQKYNPSPIIIAKGPHNEDIVIDGNHRMYHAIINKFESISAYVLDVEESIECIHTEELKKIFKIHKNLMEISYRVAGRNRRKLCYSDRFENGKLFPLYNRLGAYLFSAILFFLEL